MASARPEPGSNDQQVMPAQSTNTPPQGVDAAVAHMDVAKLQDLTTRDSREHADAA